MTVGRRLEYFFLKLFLILYNNPYTTAPVEPLTNPGNYQKNQGLNISPQSSQAEQPYGESNDAQTRNPTTPSETSELSRLCYQKDQDLFFKNILMYRSPP